MSALSQDMKDRLDVLREREPGSSPLFDAIERTLELSPQTDTTTVEVFKILGLDPSTANTIEGMPFLMPSTVLAVGYIMGLQTAGEDIIIPTVGT